MPFCWPHLAASPGHLLDLVLVFPESCMKINLGGLDVVMPQHILK
jgi:hypothetical protein